MKTQIILKESESLCFTKLLVNRVAPARKHLLNRCLEIHQRKQANQLNFFVIFLKCTKNRFVFQTLNLKIVSPVESQNKSNFWSKIH